ncbi:hypothetical protein RRG08_034666 [Elysia crispata]|uniref:Uncharacterized protein n=1 Tax=Elysia crispata TaxID=231223 RepID=A0AAE0Z0S6_9GAST|nr:hypothetical protein RRG08_034666 [Elysia crispata]
MDWRNGLGPSPYLCFLPFIDIVDWNLVHPRSQVSGKQTRCRPLYNQSALRCEERGGDSTTLALSTIRRQHKAVRTAQSTTSKPAVHLRALRLGECPIRLDKGRSNPGLGCQQMPCQGTKGEKRETNPGGRLHDREA